MECFDKDVPYDDLVGVKREEFGPYRSAMKCFLMNSPIDLYKRHLHTYQDQPIHIDVGMPKCFWKLAALSTALIIISTTSQSVFVWIIPGTHERNIALAHAHLW